MWERIGAARCRKLRCRKCISLVVRRCSYTPATEHLLQSIRYARSVVSRSGAALRRHHGTLFNKDMEPKGDFFSRKIIRPKSSIEPLVVPSKILNIERKRGQCQDSWVCLSET